MFFINKNQIVHGLIEAEEVFDYLGTKPPAKQWVLMLTVTTGQRIPIRAQDRDMLISTAKDLGLTFVGAGLSKPQ